jgi:hypothetical protein
MTELERRNRIRVSLFAYAYEIMDDPLIEDGEYDALSRRIDPKSQTGHAIMDRFFSEQFQPDTGMWIHQHPEWSGIASIYQRITGKLAKHIACKAVEPQGAQPIRHNTQKHGFTNHFDMLYHLSTLGLNIVPGFFKNSDGSTIEYRMNGDGIRLINRDTNEERMILHDDLREFIREKMQ